MFSQAKCTRVSGLKSYSRVCLLVLSTVPFTVLLLLACHLHGDGALPYVARASRCFTSPNSTQRRGGRLSTLRSDSSASLEKKRHRRSGTPCPFTHVGRDERPPTHTRQQHIRQKKDSNRSAKSKAGRNSLQVPKMENVHAKGQSTGPQKTAPTT